MLQYSKLLECKTRLRPFWQPQIERCGVIRQGEIIETPNIHPAPWDNFEFQQADLTGAEATWHSHPASSANLSIADYWFFKSWPKLLHFIISEREVRCYSVLENTVRNLDEADDHSAWVSGRSL